MDKKNREIESKLWEYADRQEGSLDLLTPAMELLREQKGQKTPKRRGFLRAGLSFAAMLAVLLVGIFVLVPLLTQTNPIQSGNDVHDKNTPPVISTYSPNLLSAKTVTEEGILAASKREVVFPALSGGFDAKYALYSFKASGAPAFAVYNVRLFAEDGPHDILLIAEFSAERCNVFSDFLLLPAYDEQCLASTTFENGEYVSRAYLVHNDIRYYFTLVRPADTGLDAYLNAIAAL